MTSRCTYSEFQFHLVYKITLYQIWVQWYLFLINARNILNISFATRYERYSKKVITLRFKENCTVINYEKITNHRLKW